MSSTRLNRNSGRCRRIGSQLAVALVLFSASGCEFFTGKDMLPPRLDAIDPQSGLPGTQVTLVGSDLRDPCTDDSAVLLFDGIEIRGKIANRSTCEPVPAEQLNPAEGIVLFWGKENQDSAITVATDDGSPEHIRFLTPLREPTNKIVDIQVVNKNGVSNIVKFFDGTPPDDIAQCLEETGSIEACTLLEDFAGAVILAGTRELAFLRLHKDNAGTTDPVLGPVAWAEGLNSLKISYDVAGYDNVAHDVRIDALGGGAFARSKTPVTQGEDGVHDLVVLDDKYETLITSYETGVRPTRLASTGLASQDAADRLIAALSEGSSRVDVFSGNIYGDRETYSLLGLGGAARPKAATFDGANRLWVAGTDPIGGSAWVAVVDREAGTVTPVTGLTLGEVTPVDIVINHWPPEAATTTYTDVYVAFNAGEGEDVQAGILRYREVSSGERETSTLSLPAGRAIGALALDNRSHFGHPDPDAYPGTAPQKVNQIWASVDDRGGDDDFLLGIRLSKDLSFPGEDQSYGDWKASMIALAADEVSAYDAATAAAALSATDVTYAINGVTVPALPAVEVRLLDTDAAFNGPFGITVVPNNVEIEKSQSFLMVTNVDGNSVTLVRTDAAGPGAGPGARQQPSSETLTGYAWSSIDTGADSAPGRLYCTQTQ